MLEAFRVPISWTEIFKRTDTPNPTFRIFLPAPNGGFPVTIPTNAKAAAIVVVAEAGTAKAASTPYQLPGSAASCA